MPRSIWSGAISFGLVNVPVKMYTAVRQKDVHFNQLHEKDGGRIRQKRVCSIDGEEVPYEEIAKGYEIADGQYVMIDPDELEALDPVATHTVDITDFVDLDDIDPLYYDKSYYLVPDERGGKPYRLLLEAMRDAGKVGIAKVIMRTKEYLVAVRPLGDALVLTTLNYADEVVPQAELDELPSGKIDVSDRELRMAEQLIESLAAKWDPEQYSDTHRQKVLDLIEKKAEGQEIVAPAEPERPAPVIDLMAALEASLAAAKKGRDGAGDGDGGAGRGGRGGAEKPKAKKKATSRSKAS